MPSQFIRSALVLLAALAFATLPAAASNAGSAPVATQCAPALAGGDGAVAAALGLQDAIPVSGCPAFCSSHSDCETACPSILGVYCDFSSWTCKDPNDDDDPGGGSGSCPAFCSSHSDCETACPTVSGVYCDFNSWTCKP